MQHFSAMMLIVMLGDYKVYPACKKFGQTYPKNMQSDYRVQYRKITDTVIQSTAENKAKLCSFE